MNNGSCEFESHLGHQIVARAIQTALATNFFPTSLPITQKAGQRLFRLSGLFRWVGGKNVGLSNRQTPKKFGRGNAHPIHPIKSIALSHYRIIASLYISHRSCLHTSIFGILQKLTNKKEWLHTIICIFVKSR